jgi:hypothetical protein
MISGDDWSRYNAITPVMCTSQLTRGEINNLLVLAYARFYSPWRIAERYVRWLLHPNQRWVVGMFNQVLPITWKWGTITAMDFAKQTIKHALWEGSSENPIVQRGLPSPLEWGKATKKRGKDFFSGILKPSKGNLVEWWYFNLLDEEKDLQLFFVYSLLGRHFGLATMMVGVYKQGRIWDVCDYYPIWSSSVYERRVSIGNCKMWTQDGDTYILRGETKNGRISWDLRYLRASPEYSSPPSLGETAHLCHLPSAHVTGTVTLDKFTYPVNARGYHDHNRGNPPFHTTQWRWATVCDPENNFSMILEQVGDDGIPTLVVFLGKDFVHFEKLKISYADYVRHIAFSRRVPVLVKYPKTWRLWASNEESRINLTMEVKKNLPLYLGGIGAPYIINEGVSRFNGDLTLADKSCNFDIRGFSEYTQQFSLSLIR